MLVRWRKDSFIFASGQPMSRVWFTLSRCSFKTGRLFSWTGERARTGFANSLTGFCPCISLGFIPPMLILNLRPRIRPNYISAVERAGLDAE
ncbi:hypothetical protein [Mesorhizobium sp.]|uniref:hypothetical protein n=1 Tax=Mesorhizobium sp. TaxID=1871066 RepID=UPI0012198834|nr:hypothetical protein [Mesorhizobium sp.]TIN23335.1 MAG: hypothetical protein E5Y19_27825 [Mesorhizobium sp.]